MALIYGVGGEILECGRFEASSRSARELGGCAATPRSAESLEMLDASAGSEERATADLPTPASALTAVSNHRRRFWGYSQDKAKRCNGVVELLVANCGDGVIAAVAGSVASAA